MIDNKYMPAFPQPNKRDNPQVIGLSKREYFAGLALQGLLASLGQHDVTHFDELASDAVMAADAFIIELSKIQP